MNAPDRQTALAVTNVDGRLRGHDVLPGGRLAQITAGAAMTAWRLARGVA